MGDVPVLHMDAPRGKRSRLSWNPDLERRFQAAVDSLGGLEEATPARIKERMHTDLTLRHIKSHLQKTRLLNNAPAVKLHRSGSGTGSDSGSGASSGGHSHVDRTRELSAQLESELSGFDNFHW